MGHSGEYLIRAMLLRNKSYKRVDQTLPTAGGESFDSNFFWSQSGKTAFDQILKALQEDATNRIGLYGIGGCGKTKLVDQVGRKAKEMKLFDQVLFIFVSSNPNIRRVQEEVAGMLDLKLKEESEAVRAKQIWLRLRHWKRVLVILDDVWEQMDLEVMGIPSSDAKLKLIFTTRNEHVCSSMGCQKNVMLNVLPEDEAWSMFKKCAAIHDGSTNLDVAREIARECGGLHLAIKVVADALRGRAVVEWRLTLEKLKALSPNQEENIKDDIYQILKLSYSHLKSELSKLLFLVCCLFPEDHQILIEDLIKLAIQLDLCGKFDTDTEIVRSQVKVAINSLIDSCLLMQSDTGDYVKVHDVVRDVGLFIGSKEDPANMANLEKGVKEFTENNRDLLDLNPLSGTQDTTSVSVTQSNTVVPMEYHPPVVVEPFKPGEAVAILNPSGKMVDFDGLCLVDESFLPLLKDACARAPHLMKRHGGHSLIFRQCAFNCLGQVLFLLKNVRIKDMVHCKDVLQMYWEDVKVMNLDLEWLSPVVERALSSTILLQEADRIGKLREEVKNWSAEAAKLREDLRVLEDKVVVAQREIALIQPKLDSLGINDVSNYFM